MTLLEAVACVLGLIAVGLVVLRSVWNYPFGLVMVTLYAWIFWEAKLYSDALLQVFFFVVQVYGWREWLRHRDGQGLVAPTVLSADARAGVALLTAFGAAALGFVMSRWTDAALPWWDAAIAGMSVTGQILQSFRRIETWVCWIATNVVAIGVYWEKDLSLTAGLYVVFLVMAIAGLVTWSRQLQRVS